MRKHFSKFLTVEIGESERRAEALASTFGKVLLTTDVRINTSVGTYLCGADAIPFHTDHPDAEIIMWYCIEQDQTDGSQLLCDAWAAYNLLSLNDMLVLKSIKSPVKNPIMQSMACSTDHYVRSTA